MKLTYPKHQPAFKQVFPLYLISSDDDLLKRETLQELKAHLKKIGFTEWLRLDADQHGSRQQLLQQTQNFSLFSTKQAFIMECRQFNEALRETLVSYAATQPKDCVLLVSIPKLEKRQTESKWYQTLEVHSCHITIWPIDPQAMPDWVKTRAQHLGFALEPDAIIYLCEHTEHNTQAAAQELEKLGLSFRNKTVTLTDLQHTLAQSSQYHTYELSDAILQGDIFLTRQILACLKAQKAESFALLMSVVYTLKQVLKIHELSKAMSVSQAFQACGIWPKKAPLYEAALNRCSAEHLIHLLFQGTECERILKGLHVIEDKQAYFERWVERCCFSV